MILKPFKEFIDSDVVSKRSPDHNRAKSLRKEAENRYLFLDELQNKLVLVDENANYFIECAYDILISLLRAKLLES